MANDTPGENIPKSDSTEASTEGTNPDISIEPKNESPLGSSPTKVTDNSIVNESKTADSETLVKQPVPVSSSLKTPKAHDSPGSSITLTEEAKVKGEVPSPTRRNTVRSRQQDEAKRSFSKRSTEARPVRGAKRLRGDREFLPSIDMMIHDYDDERTIAEEESLGTLEDPQTELSSLQKEGDMPIEDLMAMYGYGEEVNGGRSTKTESRLCPDDTESTGRPSRAAAKPPSEDEEGSGEEEEKKKTIMIGSDYQARVPAGLLRYDDALPYENEDKLVWDPAILSPKEVEEYLREAGQALADGGLPRGAHIRDDEQALYMLLQCGHNMEEALRRLRLSLNQPEEMSPWSEEECRNYELGLRSFGKDFRRIQQHKVKTRTVSELVQFYYLWKKTERHDVFANSARLEKKKYSLHPGITDYMDRFLDEQDGSNSRERSSSPPPADSTPVIKIEKEEKDSGEEKKSATVEKILLNPK